jgi:hypothetical protein
MSLLQDRHTATPSATRTPIEERSRWSARIHIKVRLHSSGYLLERCEQVPCFVDPNGVATCGRLACPSCGRGSGNLSSWQLEALSPGDHVACDCGHMWIPRPRDPRRPSMSGVTSSASTRNGAMS